MDWLCTEKRVGLTPLPANKEVRVVNPTDQKIVCELMVPVECLRVRVKKESGQLRSDALWVENQRFTLFLKPHEVIIVEALRN